MQKWCPEPLTIDPDIQGGFVPLSDRSDAAEASNLAFRPEAGFAEPAHLLAALSRDERTQIIELVAQDIRREYEDRAQAESAALNAAETQRVAQAVADCARWRTEFSEGIRHEVEDALSTLARHTVDIAVIMAEKLVRREIETDRDVLVRALETVLYKVEAGSSMQVTAHPEDAAWLREHADLRERLRVTEVKEDRRLERGGALVKSNDSEWDATIERQLSVLGETFEEAFLLPAESETENDCDDPTGPVPEDHDA